MYIDPQARMQSEFGATNVESLEDIVICAINKTEDKLNKLKQFDKLLKEYPEVIKEALDLMQSIY